MIGSQGKQAKPSCAVDPAAHQGADVAESGDLQPEPAGIEMLVIGGRETWINNALHDADIVLALWLGKSDAGCQELGRAVSQEGAVEIHPWAVNAVQHDSWHVHGRKRHAGDNLTPVEADLEEALERTRGPEVLDDG